MHQPRDQLAVHPDIVAIGASLGGVDAIPRLLSLLPSDLFASVLVVLHRPTEQISILRGILARKSNMHVTHPS
jgi:chemotaxis response regulator CheB